MSDMEKGDAIHTGRVNAASNGGVTGRIPGAHIANPAALGLISFASTTFILSLYNTTARDIHTPNAVVGMALFCGGLAQLLAGMWEFPKGNMFGATAFSSYGAFCLSYATILLPGSGIGAAYADEAEFASAIGIYLMTWFVVTFLFFIVALRKSFAFIALFGFLWMTFLLLGVAEFVGSNGNATMSGNIAKAGGALGIVTALVAYYIALSELLTAEKAAVARLPLFAFKHD